MLMVNIMYGTLSTNMFITLMLDSIFMVDFNAPTEAIVWWSEGVAEYIANQDNNQAAIDTIKDGSTYTLGAVFDTTYAGFDQDRIYRWGYLAVRFMFERHPDEVNKMLASTRTGDWAAYKSRLNSWASAYGSEFASMDSDPC